MKYRTIAHNQLVAFTIIVPSIIALIELIIILCLPKKELWNFIFVGVQAFLVWFICFALYSYSYKIIEINGNGIKCAKTEIEWECLQKIELKEIKLMQYSLLPTITCSSMAYFYGIKNEVIGIAITKRNCEMLFKLGKEKSTEVSKLCERIKM